MNLDFPRPSTDALIYIIGPFTPSEHFHNTKMNIYRAQRVAQTYLNMGYTVFCPHANWGTIEHDLGISRSYESMMGSCFRILRICDGAVTVSGWLVSKGSQREVAYCRKHNIPLRHDNGG